MRAGGPMPYLRMSDSSRCSSCPVDHALQVPSDVRASVDALTRLAGGIAEFVDRLAAD